MALPPCYGRTYDTLRNIPQIQARQLQTPWWQLNNPPGARNPTDIVDQATRLRVHGLWEQPNELHQLSVQQALFHRKYTLELLRSRPDTLGYVVSGETDTLMMCAVQNGSTVKWWFVPDGHLK